MCWPGRRESTIATRTTRDTDVVTAATRHLPRHIPTPLDEMRQDGHVPDTVYIGLLRRLSYPWPATPSMVVRQWTHSNAHAGGMRSEWCKVNLFRVILDKDAHTARGYGEFIPISGRPTIGIILGCRVQAE